MGFLEFIKRACKPFLKKIKTPFQKKLLRIFVFLVKFAALSLPLHFLLWVNFDASRVQLFVAGLIEKLLLSSGVEVIRNGVILGMQTKTAPLTVEIIKDCVGWKSVLALLGLIFATPNITFKKRILGAVVGAIIVFLGNILRIYSTIYVTVLKGTAFWEITHGFLWREGLMLLVILTWYTWLKIFEQKALN